MKKIFLILFLTLELFSKNLLFKEESPYLKQHSSDPIFWKPYKKIFFEKAKKEEKFILISSGYSTCHWCHVMQKESFKDKKIASILNKHFISIKIDKEETPHLDIKYQNLYQKLTNNRKSWPLTIILSPSKEIVFASSYLPKDDDNNFKGLETTLLNMINLDKKKLKKLITKNKSILSQKKSAKKLNKELLLEKYLKIAKNKYDKENAGFEKAPKFPLAKNLDTLIDFYKLTKDRKILKLVTTSLDKMAKGAIYDQISGGFFRYSVLANWNKPHFEKMLYTQAELISTYYKAYLLTKKKLYLKVIKSTIKNINEFLRNENYLYHSASNADSKNYKGKLQEGFYFTFFFDEAKKALLEEEITNHEEILYYLGFDEFGNFEEEQNIVYINEKFKKPKNLKKAIKILSTLKEKKEKPFIDKKIITSWNALMIKSLFEVSNLDKKYLIMAKKSLNQLLKNVYINKKLYHQKYLLNTPSKEALLEDYSLLTSTLLMAFDKTYEKKYLNLAKEFTTYINKHFYENKTWYLDPLKYVKADFEDRYYVSALSQHFSNMLSISNIEYDLKALKNAKKLIKEQYLNFTQDIFLNPNSINIFLRAQKGDVILKSNKQNLLKNKSKINNINYPYLLTNLEKTDSFLACDEKSCFSFSKNIKDVIKTIDKN